MVRIVQLNATTHGSVFRPGEVSFVINGIFENLWPPGVQVVVEVGEGGMRLGALPPSSNTNTGNDRKNNPLYFSSQPPRSPRATSKNPDDGQWAVAGFHCVIPIPTIIL